MRVSTRTADLSHQLAGGIQMQLKRTIPMDGCALGQSTNKEMVMTAFNTDADFVASLNHVQREYYLGRQAELQHQLQDTMRDLSRSLGMVGALHSDVLSLLSADSTALRRILTVDGTEYRYATVPGSERIRISFRNGVAIAMWEGRRKNPWVLPLEGYAAFQRTGHAKPLHRQLLDYDRRRRTS